MIESLIPAAEVTELCQRNWDHSKPIPEEHIEEILGVATRMPTKQSLPIYEIAVSTSKTLNRNLAHKAQDPRTPSSIGRNAQVSAPLLLMWLSDPNAPQFNQDKCYEATGIQFKSNPADVQLACGISAGGASLAAANLGYKTGFCGCFLLPHMINIAAEEIPEVEGKELHLMLGIGHPHPLIEERNILESPFWTEAKPKHSIKGRVIRPLGPKHDMIKIHRIKTKTPAHRANISSS